MPTVAEIASAVPLAKVRGDETAVASGITHDSRQVRPGCVFAVLKGERVDGGAFVDGAVKNGAVALLVEKFLDVDIPQICVKDARGSLGAVASACYGDPTSQLTVVGITGTNGKTTTAYMVEAVLASTGAVPGVMTTVQYRVGQKNWKADHTTPEATVVQSTAAQILSAGATHLILEASSHGLSLGRLNNCRFDVVAFSNLTQDHLDFHRDMDDYGAAKMTLFTKAIEKNKNAHAVVNVDDPFSTNILNATKHSHTTVSNDPTGSADIRPLVPPTFSIDGIAARITTPKGEHALNSPLIGPHNLSNLLLTLGISMALGIDPEAGCRGLSSLAVVPGRLERVGMGGVAVFVDYAHTPDALAHVLSSLSTLTRGRLICVFGCGGDRDRKKRPIMGRVVGNVVDIAVVTSDNPRTETPEAILSMITPGVAESGLKNIDSSDLGEKKTGYVVICDRAEAIETAISNANPKDTVLIAGKGHEDYQILGTDRIHFDDREHAALALSTRDGGDRA